MWFNCCMHFLAYAWMVTFDDLSRCMRNLMGQGETIDDIEEDALYDCCQLVKVWEDRHASAKWTFLIYTVCNAIL